MRVVDLGVTLTDIAIPADLNFPGYVLPAGTTVEKVYSGPQGAAWAVRDWRLVARLTGGGTRHGEAWQAYSWVPRDRYASIERVTP